MRARNCRGCLCFWALPTSRAVGVRLYPQALCDFHIPNPLTQMNVAGPHSLHVLAARVPRALPSDALVKQPDTFAARLTSVPTVASPYRWSVPHSRSRAGTRPRRQRVGSTCRRVNRLCGEMGSSGPRENQPVRAQPGRPDRSSVPRLVGSHQLTEPHA